MLVLDTASDQLLKRVKLSGLPNQCAATPDGQIVGVPIRGGDRLDLVDVAKGKVVKSLPVKVPHKAPVHVWRIEATEANRDGLPGEREASVRRFVLRRGRTHSRPSALPRARTSVRNGEQIHRPSFAVPSLSQGILRPLGTGYAPAGGVFPRRSTGAGESASPWRRPPFQDAVSLAQPWALTPIRSCVIPAAIAPQLSARAVATACFGPPQRHTGRFRYACGAARTRTADSPRSGLNLKKLEKATPTKRIRVILADGSVTVSRMGKQFATSSQGNVVANRAQLPSAPTHPPGDGSPAVLSTDGVAFERRQLEPKPISPSHNQQPPPLTAGRKVGGHSTEIAP